MADPIKLIDEKIQLAKTQRHLAKQNNYATKIKTANDQIELLESLKAELSGSDEAGKSTKTSKSKKKSKKKED